MLPRDQMLGIEIWPRLSRNDWFVVGNRDLGDEYAYIKWEEGDSATAYIREKILVGLPRQVSKVCCPR